MKQQLVILHGALGASVQFEALATRLEEHFDCFLFDFPGHGRGADTKELSIEVCAEAVHAWMKQKEIIRPIVFGYSMGGYVALCLEAAHPGMFTSICTLGTKFDWTPEGAEREIGFLNPDKIEEKVPSFAQYLKSVHSPRDWKAVVLATHGLMRKLGNQPLLHETILHGIEINVQLMRGAEDSMVSSAETSEVADKMPNAVYEELEGIPHPIQQIQLDQLLPTLLARLQVSL